MSSLGFCFHVAISDGFTMNKLRFDLSNEDFSMGQDCRPWIWHLKLPAQDPGHMVFTARFTAFQANSQAIY